MPTYKFECRECEAVFDKFLSMKESEEQINCLNCNSNQTFKKIFATNFNLVGDGWTGKNIKIKGQMMKRGQKAGARQEEFRRDSGKIPTLAPNVGGERVSSWSDAAKLAKDQGRNVESYNHLIQKEEVKI